MSTAQPVTEREVPAQIDFPEQLPVSERRADIEAAIRDHQVVILAGETGSGKTTQLPKICLNLGRGRQLRRQWLWDASARRQLVAFSQNEG